MQYLRSSPKKINPLNQSSDEKNPNNFDEKNQLLEKQFFRVYRNLIIISQLFLSAPMGLQKPQKCLRRKDLLLNRLHIMWCLSVYTFLAYCVYDEYTMSNIELPTVQKPLYFSEYLVYLIHLLECMRLIYFRRDNFRNLQTLVLSFDRILIEMKVRVHYDDLKHFIRRHKVLILIHFIICAIIGYFYKNCKVLYFLRTNTVYILPNVVINISLVQYYALLFLVYKRGEKLYFLLDTLLNTSNPNDILKFRQELNLIRSLFAHVDRFTKKVNDHFSISICLVYLGSFLNISINIFLLYKYLNAWGNSNPAWSLYSLAWTFMHIGKMILILYYNQKVQNMKSKTTLLLSSFKFEYPGAETTLRLFILQLMSDTRSNYVCGLLALNMNFIQSLAVAISTLFIFLVQYDITFEALTSTYNSARPH